MFLISLPDLNLLLTLNSTIERFTRHLVAQEWSHPVNPAANTTFKCFSGAVTSTWVKCLLWVFPSILSEHEAELWHNRTIKWRERKEKKKAQLVSAALINGEISQMDSGGSEASPPHRLRQCFPVAPVSCWSCICPAVVMVHGSEYSHRNTKQFWSCLCGRKSEHGDESRQHGGSF